MGTLSGYGSTVCTTAPLGQALVNRLTVCAATPLRPALHVERRPVPLYVALCPLLNTSVLLSKLELFARDK